MTTSDETSGAEPETNPADRKAEKIRERTLDLLANVAVHVQRMEDVARKLGLTADLVDGVGDYLYESVVAQLDLASKIVDRSQAVADRLLDLGAEKIESSRYLRIEGQVGTPARHFFVVANASAKTAHVKVAIESASLGGRVSAKPGKSELPGRQETGVEIVIDTAGLDASRVYSGRIRVTLDYEVGGPRELPVRDFELWLRAP
jgi:hypothetical protein